MKKSKPQNSTLNYVDSHLFYVKCFIWRIFLFHESVSMSVRLYTSTPTCCRTAAVAGFIHHDKPANSATVTHNHTSLQLAGPQSENEWQFIDKNTSYIFLRFSFLFFSLLFSRGKCSFVVRIAVFRNGIKKLINGGFCHVSASHLF